MIIFPLLAQVEGLGQTAFVPNDPYFYTGTTILYQILKDSLQGENVCLFEPLHCRPPDSIDLTGKNVLSKVLLIDLLAPIAIPPRPSFFDKRIFIRRDPRDQLVSNFLYGAMVLPVTSDFQKFVRFCAALRAKEECPHRISFLDLWRLQGQLSCERPLAPLEKCLDRLRISLRVFQQHQDGLFPVAYEDIVDRRLGNREQYLGFAFGATAEVDPRYRRVVRTKGYGDWRNWFLPGDVDYFRPVLAELMAGSLRCEPGPSVRLAPDERAWVCLRQFPRRFRLRSSTIKPAGCKRPSRSIGRFSRSSRIMPMRSIFSA